MDGWKSARRPIPRGTTGAVSELRVAADLLERGYEVFRAVSPSCSCDLAVLKDGKLVRVEVRTGYESPTGRRHLGISLDERHRYDIAAGVFPSEIVYSPSLP